MTNDLLSSFVKSLWMERMKFRSILFKGILFKRRLDVCVYGKIFVRKIKDLYLFRVYTLFERIKFYFRKSRFKNYQKRQEDSIVMFFLVRNIDIVITK